MFSSSSARKSVDSLPALPPTSRSEYPLHSRTGRSSSRPRRGSTASSIRSFGGGDSSSSNWTNSIHETGQNAISTLLQPPIVRTGLLPHVSAPALSAHKPPTARDIPPVTLTNITHVDNDDFSPYLTQFTTLYEQLRRVKESEVDTSVIRRNSKQDEEVETASTDGYLRPSSKPPMGRKGSSASLSSIGSTDAPAPARRRSSSGFGRKSAQGPAPLSTIPNVYFDEDFHLENPRTFDVVSERSEVITANRPGENQGDTNGAVAAPRKALATNAILQEKLSWYMDTIEVHLVNSISTASTTFFNALGDLKELHSEAAESVRRIQTLRNELDALDKEVVTQGVEILHKHRIQENLRQLSDVVTQLRQIVDGVANCEALVDAGEIDEALDSIDSLEDLIAGEVDQSGEEAPTIQYRDLQGALALRGVDADLAALRFRIGKAYETKFVNILLGDVRRHVEQTNHSEVLLRWSNAASRAKGGHARSPSVFPSYLSQTDELKTQLLPTMMGLERSHYVAAATATYRESLLREVRNLIRRPLPSSNDDDNESMMSSSTAGGGKRLSNQEKSSLLARNLRAMDPGDAETLLTTVYVGVTETLRRLTTQTKIIMEVAMSAVDPMGLDGIRSPPFRSPMNSPRPDRYPSNPALASSELYEELHKTLDVANLLGQAIDVAIEKIVKVLKVRSEQATSLPHDFFLRYFTLNLYFANECESISGRSGTSLKTVVNGHIRDFVQKNRDAEMQKLAQGMESDQWAVKDFTEKDTELLAQILDATTHDNAAWTERTKIWIPYSELDSMENELEPEANGTNKDKTRPAIIDAEKFILPNSAVLCLQGVATFMQLISGIPSMTTDIASSLVAYLQLFNSRCTQLILGAGATKSAGLKNITSKHLALAAQALSFISTLIPHIREFVRRHAGSGSALTNLMGEFDKVRRLLQEHQDNIHQKLVDIMSGRAAAHSRSLRAINWDTQTPSGTRPYMETLVKETSTLHRVLTKHLPEAEIKMIMGPVFSNYKEHLGQAIRESIILTQPGYDSLMLDLRFFTTKLSKIDGFLDAGDTLSEIARTKRPRTPEEPDSANTEPADTEPQPETSG
ncbi:unnamed protein product [Clonostachys byssicola]|uniref:Vacuolar protein sorting-associated protein 54 n=1 Tax=Clonostachys byssicola TaxID=160290 RepID=A0A9N9Y8S3_9HYPO|nr:unnamed protein product [Clonostachys byssicola]